MTTSAQSKTLIENLRSLLDDADEELMVALAYRCWLAKAIQQVSQQTRESNIRTQRTLDRAITLGIDLNLDPVVVQAMYTILFRLS